MTRYSRVARWVILSMVLVFPGFLHAKPFRIHVVDAATSRGVPNVRLRALTGQVWVTDSAGMAAVDDGIVNGKRTYFKPETDGYHYEGPGLAMGGFSVEVKPGTSLTITLKRDNIAERLYRVTGPGIYRDSVALGDPVPIAHPLVNANVIGQDSVLTSVYHGRIFWIWGDTTKLNHPLGGNFRSTGAWSDLPGKGGLDPDKGVNLEYITKDDFVQPMVPKSNDRKSQTYWISALVTLPDARGREHLLADYSRIAMPGMRTIEHGMLEFDDAERHFKFLRKDDPDTSAGLNHRGGHIRIVHDAGTSASWCYAVASSRLTRCPARYESATDASRWEALTCLPEGAIFTTATRNVDRDSHGKLRYSWKKNTSPIDYAAQEKLVAAGVISEQERRFYPVDADTGQTILPHGATMAWNSYRRKWIMVFSQMFGSSLLGEQWFMESDSPEGPWFYARKVVTHHNYTFYNPLIHPELVSDPASPCIYFEATYTTTFSGNEHPTPLYDYNQMMYRLNLEDPRLELPVPIYRADDGSLAPWNGEGRAPASDRIVFFAPAGGAPGTVAVRRKPGSASFELETGGASSGKESAALFYALPADSPATTHTVLLLPDGQVRRDGSGKASAHAVARVWENLAAHAVIGKN